MAEIVFDTNFHAHLGEDELMVNPKYHKFDSGQHRQFCATSDNIGEGDIEVYLTIYEKNQTSGAVTDLQVVLDRGEIEWLAMFLNRELKKADM